MKNKLDLQSLSPDLYLRYFSGFEIIKKIQGNKPCSILDVGGRAGIMGDFIKNEKLPYTLTVIDSLPDDESTATTCDEYIKDDFIKHDINFKFDYLTSFDVLEHVDNKKAFINKCISSCDQIILTAPFKSTSVTFVEDVIDNFFLNHKNIHHPWLIEHFENGLPEEEWLENIFNSHKILFKVFNSNNTENWVNFMMPNLLPALYSVDTEELAEINLYYNKNYIILGDLEYPCYRKIFVTFPNKKKILFNKLSFKKTKINVQTKIVFNKMVINYLVNCIENEKSQSNQYLQVLNEKESLEDEIKITKEKILDEKRRLENEIVENKKEINDYSRLLNAVIYSKFYKAWQFYNNLKRKMN